MTETDVKRGDVFCSKIIHQHASHQSRFVKHAVYRKILQFSYPDWDGQPNPDGTYPPPLASPFPCYQCHRKFTCAPVFLPFVVLDGARTEWGNFCSPPCVNTYVHQNMNDSELPALAADLFQYCQDVHGWTAPSLGFAPHFALHETYGGDMTDAMFDAVSWNSALRAHARTAPFIPTEVVVEWQCRTDKDSSTAESEKTLAALLGPRPEMARHHHEWNVRGLRQKPLAAIEQRLLSLPAPEQRESLYQIYLQRHKEAESSGAGATTRPQTEADISPPLSPPSSSTMLTAATTDVAVSAVSEPSSAPKPTEPSEHIPDDGEGNENVESPKKKRKRAPAAPKKRKVATT